MKGASRWLDACAGRPAASAVPATAPAITARRTALRNEVFIFTPVTVVEKSAVDLFKVACERRDFRRAGHNLDRSAQGNTVRNAVADAVGVFFIGARLQLPNPHVYRSNPGGLPAGRGGAGGVAGAMAEQEELARLLQATARGDRQA